MEKLKLGNVQAKMHCVYETRVVEEASGKRTQQPYRVEATEHLRQAALDHHVCNALATEKLDGTCVHVRLHDNKPWLWARLDRKPNKVAEKKFKKFKALHNAWVVDGCKASEPVYEWNVVKDFKEVPSGWIPADGVEVIGGVPQPDTNGHIPGWVPVDVKSRQHLWHLSCVDLHAGLALVLQVHPDDSEMLEIAIRPLTQLQDSTLELIGTHINGNPYKIGSKQQPLHLLVRHGSIVFTEKPPLDYVALRDWMEHNALGQVEGVVWHCPEGQLYKVHRHHVKLAWPVPMPSLTTKPIIVNTDLTAFDHVENMTLANLSNLNSQTFLSLSDITYKN